MPDLHDGADAAVRVELVDAQGRRLGSCAKLEAHQPPGRMHRALSVFVFDRAGRVLLQRRAATKYHFAGRWSNACCSHPAPGADAGRAAAMRLRSELGISASLERVGTFAYSAVDPASGLVECEQDAVFVGYVPDDVAIAPDPEEVAAVRFVELVRLRAEMERRRADFTPWLAGALDLVLAAGHPRSASAGPDRRISSSPS